MSDIAVPRTPSPLQPVRQEKFSQKSASLETEDPHTIDSQYRSTPPPAQIDLTPPPSNQVSKPARTARMIDNRESSLASPPPTGKIGPPISQGRLFGEVPTTDALETMTEEQLRTLAAELIPALSEARMSAAHSKLQHQLLGIEAGEAARRAEVEREMTLKEVQVLQESPRSYGSLMSPHSPQTSAQRHLELAHRKCRQLQQYKEEMDPRMHKAKKVIRELSAQREALVEDNNRLRQRIQQNRDHLNEMRSSGAILINGTPHSDFGTPLHHRTPKTPATARSAHHAIVTPSRSQDAFDALLIAGQVLNNEANSVPSTPTPAKVRKVNQAHHMRGAHSLSSLPSTPNRSRPVTADNAHLTPTPQRPVNPRASLSVPGKHLTYQSSSPPSTQPRRREDRDSTISASEDEGEYVGASQASQRATEMLRRSAMSNDNSPESSQKRPQTESTSQSKIYGQIKKPRPNGNERIDKREISNSVYDDIGRGPKKAKTASVAKEGVGLGINQWEGTS
ncbi:MAG: hypothetical protein Q9202_006250 [Teloschistes flavicans]